MLQMAAQKVVFTCPLAKMSNCVRIVYDELLYFLSDLEWTLSLGMESFALKCSLLE